MAGDTVAAYPWLAGPWARLDEYRRAERLPGAFLLSGARGVGKHVLARTFSQLLLCRDPRPQGACGECSGCALVRAATHPDFVMVEPVEPGKPIIIDAVREMISALSLRPQYGGHRTVIMSPAHLLTRQAANAVLKTIEEPDSHTIFFLLTDAPAALPPTVLSRCQQIRVDGPARRDLVAWLRSHGVESEVEAEALCSLACGSPLRALEMIGTTAPKRRLDVFESWQGVIERREDPVAAAALWERSGVDEVMAWFVSWIEDAACIRAVPGRCSRNNPDLSERLRAIAGRLDLGQLLESLAAVQRAQRALGGQINRQFLMEELAIRWARSGAA